jgi:hypothetical protein
VHSVVLPTPDCGPARPYQTAHPGYQPRRSTRTGPGDTVRESRDTLGSAAAAGNAAVTAPCAARATKSQADGEVSS